MNYGEFPALVGFLAVLFENLTKNRKTYQLGHEYCNCQKMNNLTNYIEKVLLRQGGG